MPLPFVYIQKLLHQEPPAHSAGFKPCSQGFSLKGSRYQVTGSASTESLAGFSPLHMFFNLKAKLTNLSSQIGNVAALKKKKKWKQLLFFPLNIAQSSRLHTQPY